MGHPAFRNDAEAMAFAWMILRASWQPTKVRYKGHIISLARGELAISVRDMAEAHERPKGWVERLLTRLKNETMIETRCGTAARTAPLVVTIRNYNAFQFSPDEPRTASQTAPETEVRTGAGQEPDTEQVREEDNKDSDSKESTPRNAFPRPDFVEPDLWRDFILNRRKKRIANTATAHKKMLEDIERFTTAEWPRERIFRHAVESGWAGIYDPKGSKRGNGRTSGKNSTGTTNGFQGALREISSRGEEGDYANDG